MQPPVVVLSFIAPKSSALKTGDRAARMHLCAQNVSPATWNTTSAPSWAVRRPPSCRFRSDGGTAMNRDLAALSSVRTSSEIRMSQLILKLSPFRCSEFSSQSLWMKSSKPAPLPATEYSRKLVDRV
uniref:Uncharacterized protein n=1 Tax=Arundo donax TaxID=35708 RepID=A0A0A8YJQ7_ARUDO